VFQRVHIDLLKSGNKMVKSLSLTSKMCTKPNKTWYSTKISIEYSSITTIFLTSGLGKNNAAK